MDAAVGCLSNAHGQTLSGLGCAAEAIQCGKGVSLPLVVDPLPQRCQPSLGAYSLDAEIIPSKLPHHRASLVAQVHLIESSVGKPTSFAAYRPGHSPSRRQTQHKPSTWQTKGKRLLWGKQIDPFHGTENISRAQTTDGEYLAAGARTPPQTPEAYPMRRSSTRSRTM